MPVRPVAVLVTLLACLLLAPAAHAAAPVCRPLQLPNMTRHADPVFAEPVCTGTWDHLEVTTPAAHGTADVIFGTSFRYTPNPNYVGQDTFTFKAFNGTQGSAETTATVTITNATPECGSDVLRIRRDKPASAVAPCFDPDGDPFTLTILRQPDHAVAGSNGNQLTVDPVDGYRGFDSLQARASDGVAQSQPFEVEILVTRNHAPRCLPETVHTKIGEPAIVNVALACRDEDLQDQDLALSVQPGPTDQGGQLSALTGGQLTYTPPDGFTGVDTFAVTASDGTDVAQGTQRVHVANTPLCSAEAPGAVRPGATHEFAADCTQPPDDHSPLTVEQVQGPNKGTLTRTTHGFSYRAGDVASGSDGYSFKATSLVGASPAAQQQVTIDATANRDPDCQDAHTAQTVYSGRTSVLGPDCTDPDGDPLTYHPFGDPDHGTLSVSGGALEYATDRDYLGYDTASYTVTDGRGGTAGPFDYPVKAQAPEAPVCKPLSTLTMRPNRSVTFTTSCTNPQNDPQTYEIVQPPTLGTVTPTAVPGQFKYTANGAEGSETFTLRALNDVGSSAPVSIGVQIDALFNSAPVCKTSAVPFRVTKSQTTRLPLADRCSDVDEDPLTYTVTARPDGTLTPPEGPATAFDYVNATLGTDSLTFTASDGKSTSQPTTFEIEVVDSAAPTCHEQPAIEVEEGATATITLQCADPNDGALTYAIDRQPAGSLTPVGAAGGPDWRYEAPAGRTSDSFTYHATGAAGASGTYTQLITITRPNQAPTVTIHGPTTGNRGELLEFTATASDDAATPPAITWDVDGDGWDDGTGASITKSFTAAGAHTIRVRATDSDGVSVTDELTVTIGNTPPSVTAAGPTGGMRGELLTFTATALDDDDTPPTLKWDVDGDGWDDGTGASITKSFAAAGVHTIQVQATDSDGESVTDSVTVTIDNAPPSVTAVGPTGGMRGELLTFTATALDDAETPPTLTWDIDGDGWDDGTGASITKSFAAAGAHTIRVQATDSDGVSVTDAVTVTIDNAPPKVTVAGPSAGLRGQLLKFTATATDDAATPATLKWDVDGDGWDDGTGASITKSFAAAGAHTIRVQATDSDGVSVTDSVTVTIDNAPPMVTASGPTAGWRGQLLKFTATATDDAATPPTLKWDVDGDGWDDGTGASITTRFTAVGRYTIRVRAMDSDGASATDSIAVTIRNRPPTGAISVAPTTPTAGRAATFTASGSDPDGDALSWAWDLDNDGAFDDAVGLRATRAYPAGARSVRVLARDGRGGQAIARRSFTVTAAPAVVTPDTRPPDLVLTLVSGQKLRDVRADGLALNAGCGEACAVELELFVSKRIARRLRINRRAKGRVRIGQATAAAGVIHVELTTKASRAFKRARKVAVILEGSATDAAGNAGELVRLKLTLRR